MINKCLFKYKLIFHRAPTIYQNEQRLLWLESIRKHQTFEERTLYHVCKAHFRDDCFKVVGNRLLIKANAVPTIFDTGQPAQNIASFNQEKKADSEIEQLKMESIQMRLQHDVEMKRLQKKLDLSTKQCNEYKAKFVELKKKYQKIEKEKKSLAESMKNEVISFLKRLCMII